MSRLIVKNLPKGITPQKLQDEFSKKGFVTDLQFKYNKVGKFRQFAFVGYKTEEEAQAAIEYFNNSFIHTSKIQVEVCKSLGDPNTPKPWKEYLSKKEDNKQQKHDKLEKTKSERSEVIPKELLDDPKFKQFLDLNKERKSKPLWGDDIPEGEAEKNESDNETEVKEKKRDVKKQVKKKKVHNDLFTVKLKNLPYKCKKAQLKDFLQPLKPTSLRLPPNSKGFAFVSFKTEKEMNIALNKSRGFLDGRRINVVQYVKEIDSNNKDKSNQPELNEEEEKELLAEEKMYNDLFTVKLKNLPYKCTKAQLEAFLQPLNPTSLRFPPNTKGLAFVSFETEKEMKKALNKSKGFLGGNQIDIVKHIKEINTHHKDKPNQPKLNEEEEKELLAETGRIFVRNLCYNIKEEELQELFSKYGTIAEIVLPVDKFSNKAQGIAFITFMFAEHAVAAYAELDGSIFQGRVLHLIPARPKNKPDIEEEEGTSYKKKKDSKLKALSGSSHNWNILFLGANAVADVIAEKYNVEKSKLLSGESSESVAVRLALAETQVVLDTRKFLVDNNVELDAFSQAAAERSKTVIVVKNLPAKTQSKELFEKFSNFGTVVKVILPPSGLVALIEFQEPTQARAAFQNLAYSRFHHLPLYLEWAPVGVIKPRDPALKEDEKVEESEEKPVKEKENADETQEEAKKEEEEKVNDAPPEKDTTLFVKNINFDTTAEAFEKHFRQCGPLNYATISTKKDIKTGKVLSMGFGFVQYKDRASAVNALQHLHLTILDGHSLELKFSSRSTQSKADTARRKAEVREQLSSKILVKNIPFEASVKEVTALFKEFGTLKVVRLPKKFGGHEEHRGFGFVEYISKNDAKRAFEALCHSTHFFGRRLVLEWANVDSEDVTELRKKTARDFFGAGPAKKLKKSKLNEDVALASVSASIEDV